MTAEGVAPFSIPVDDLRKWFRKRKQKPKGHRRLLEVMDMFITLILVMESWMYVYVKTHKIAYIKYV